MTTNESATFGGVFGIVAVLAILVGAAIAGYGVLLVQTSLLGGGWIAAIGLSLVLSGLFATDWAGDRFDLLRTARRRLSLGFAVLAVLLLIAFVGISGASFESEAIESSS
ncbi:hypothetical protein [Natrinema versiforme]|uniref:Uncharacterized protein n=1 Tax=Natrinema versiforme JCM 10478 TaxID=1227496 RepID=L9XUJ0_9EURY|nr:hypothetical protein [Natrinema versiforme]ELY65212.1 hypothetical protein C489_15567 [Natrinema versiforme JCM 10478]